MTYHPDSDIFQAWTRTPADPGSDLFQTWTRTPADPTINRMLREHGLTVQISRDYLTDSVVFELLDCQGIVARHVEPLRDWQEMDLVEKINWREEGF